MSGDFPFWETTIGAIVAATIVISCLCLWCGGDNGGDAAIMCCCSSCIISYVIVKGGWRVLRFLFNDLPKWMNKHVCKKRHRTNSNRANGSTATSLSTISSPTTRPPSTSPPITSPPAERTRRQAVITYQPTTSFYHYTTKESFDSICKSGIIKISPPCCLLGEGVYFTQLPPHLSSEELVKNNYGKYIITQHNIIKSLRK